MRKLTEKNYQGGLIALVLLSILLGAFDAHAVECNGENFPYAADCDSCVSSYGVLTVASSTCGPAVTAVPTDADVLAFAGGYYFNNGGSFPLCVDVQSPSYHTVEVTSSAQEYTACNPPDEPENCGNLIQDADETGLDCGGSCANECVDICAVDFTFFDVGICIYSGTSPDFIEASEMGVCPEGYLRDEGDPSRCLATDASFSARPDYAPPVPDAPLSWEELLSPTSSTTSSTTRAYNQDNSYTDTTTTKTATVNPDGSVTVTESVTSENFDPEGVYLDEETTTSEANSDGTSTDALTPPEENTFDWTPFTLMVDAIDERFPISLIITAQSYMDEFVQTPSAPSWDLDFPNPWGSSWSFSIDLVGMSSIAAIVRGFLEMSVIIITFLTVLRRWS